MARLPQRVLAAVLMAVVVAAVGVAWNQRRVAAEWRDRTEIETAARTESENLHESAQRRTLELEELLASLANEAAERSDEAAFLVLQLDAARRAAERLAACGDPSRADCRSAILNATGTLSAIAGDRR